MGRKLTERQRAHREEYKKWMGMDNRIAMKNGDWYRQHAEKLRGLERDMYEMPFRGLRILK